MADDDELADALFKQYGDQRGSSRPPLVDVDYHASLLMVIASKIDNLTAATVAVQGGKPAQPEPLPWPDSAYDRARRRAEKAHTDSLTAEVYAAMDRWKQHHEGGAHA